MFSSTQNQQTQKQQQSQQTQKQQQPQQTGTTVSNLSSTAGPVIVNTGKGGNLMRDNNNNLNNTTNSQNTSLQVPNDSSLQRPSRRSLAQNHRRKLSPFTESARSKSRSQELSANINKVLPKTATIARSSVNLSEQWREKGNKLVKKNNNGYYELEEKSDHKSDLFFNFDNANRPNKHKSDKKNIPLASRRRNSLRKDSRRILSQNLPQITDDKDQLAVKELEEIGIPRVFAKMILDGYPISAIKRAMKSKGKRECLEEMAMKDFIRQCKECYDYFDTFFDDVERDDVLATFLFAEKDQKLLGILIERKEFETNGDIEYLRKVIDRVQAKKNPEIKKKK